MSDALDQVEYGVLPRSVPEGSVPLVLVEGTARECGCRYAEAVLERYPGYRRYLDSLPNPGDLDTRTAQLIEQRAPYLIDVFGGMIDVTGSPQRPTTSEDDGGCTSFGVSGVVTLDGQPISGQTKDTVIESAMFYIVLCMRIKNGPTILVLAYPGEVLGYGLWTTGMSIFRNSLQSKERSSRGIDQALWALMALAGESVEDATELARREGLRGVGNYMISDRDGHSASVEFNGGGVNVIHSDDGILAHANHPVGPDTAPFERERDEQLQVDSRHRMDDLRELLASNRGQLTPQRAMMLLADHRRYPMGICRHFGGSHERYTTAAVVAEPTRGHLHVIRGNPCCSWPTTYSA